jgi:hypothetical protein
VAELNDVGTRVPQAKVKGKLFGVPCERGIARMPFLCDRPTASTRKCMSATQRQGVC